MNFRHFALLGLSIVSVIAFSQNKTVAEADKLYKQENYLKALPIYEKLTKSYSSNTTFLYRYGTCILNTGGNIENAEQQFEKAYKKGLKTAALPLAEAQMKGYKFEEAISSYNNYLKSLPRKNNEAENIQKRIDLAVLCQGYLETITPIELIGYKVVDSTTFFQNYTISPECGSITSGEDKNLTSFGTVFTPEKGDRMIYAKTKDDAKNADLVEQLKFINTWSEPKILPGDINSKSNESFPFLQADGRTLYFSSDRTGGIGQTDLYMSRLNSSSDAYLMPRNMGFPFSSFDNDYLLVVDDLANIGYFASSRGCVPGKLVVFAYRPNPTKKLKPLESITKKRLWAKLYPFNDLIPDSLNNFPANITALPAQKPGPTLSQSTGSQPLFVVNDTIVYYDEREFISDNALKLFRESNSKLSQHDSLKTLLLHKRNKYEMSNDAAERNGLVRDLTSLESQIIKAQEVSKQLLLEARYLEIQSILKSGIQTKPAKQVQLKTNTNTTILPAVITPAVSVQPKSTDIKIPSRNDIVFQTLAFREVYQSILTPEQIIQMSRFSTNQQTGEKGNLAVDMLLENVFTTPDVKLTSDDWARIKEIDPTCNTAFPNSEIVSRLKRIQALNLNDKMEALQNRFQLLDDVARNFYTTEGRTLTQNSTKLLNDGRILVQNAKMRPLSQYRTLDEAIGDYRNKYQMYEQGIEKVENAIMDSYMAMLNTPRNEPMQTAVTNLPKQNTTTTPVKSKPATTPEVTGKVVYRIRFGLFSKSPDESKFPGFTPLYIEPLGKGLKRYYSRSYASFEEARSALENTDRTEYPDALVVKFVNGVAQKSK